MEVGSYKFHRRAVAAFNQLETDEQAKVLESLGSLMDVPAAEWSPAVARRLSDDQPLYLVGADNGWRMIVRATDGQEPEVLDLVREETLKTFANGAAGHGQ